MTNENGIFYFKKTISGNIVGEFTNILLKRKSTESADLIEPSNNDSFAGTYKTTWFELNDNESCISKLEIKRENDIYHLFWTEGSSFHGLGMILEKDILIGTYWGV